MEQIGERLTWFYFPGTDIPIPLGGVNVLTVLSTLVVMLILWGLVWLAARRAKVVPGRGQMLLEMFVSMFDNLVSSSLEMEKREDNRRFFPLIASLFMFLVMSNYMGFIPSALLEEPTGDINCTLSLGIMGSVIAAYCAIRAKGVKVYVEEFAGPMWSQEGAGTGAMIAGKLSALFFFPLNVIGELSKVVSISFRIFGNILGGGIIIIVVTQLTYNMILPVGLHGFFTFFVGAVQAFVFTMLTLTYISVAIK